jgi:hypothetical protein
MTMFVRPKHAFQEMWEGARSGLDGTTEWFAADVVCMFLERTYELGV